jgi:hypothetical protein
MTPRPPDEQTSMFVFCLVGETEIARIPEAPLVRHSDPPTSHEAAGFIAEKLNAIQQAVYAAFLERGPASARQAEAWPELRTYGFSTVRKRVSELARVGYLVEVGTETDSGHTRATVYRGVKR